MYRDDPQSSDGSGAHDDEWGPKFFEPYAELLREVPFFAVLGNHDGNETEDRADLLTYLDNFFFPGLDRAARYYRFSYGAMADVFALDTTRNTVAGAPQPYYTPRGEQHRWLATNLTESSARWKIAYFHHPPFTAGPLHKASINELSHLVTLLSRHLLSRHGVAAVFNGHEHNFQFTVADPDAGNVGYIVTGAGGKLRPANVREQMVTAEIDAWSPQAHFCAVDIQGDTMHVTPLSETPVIVRDKDGQGIPLPIRIHNRAVGPAQAVDISTFLGRISPWTLRSGIQH